MRDSYPTFPRSFSFKLLWWALLWLLTCFLSWESMRPSLESAGAEHPTLFFMHGVPRESFLLSNVIILIVPAPFSGAGSSWELNFSFSTLCAAVQHRDWPSSDGFQQSLPNKQPPGESVPGLVSLSPPQLQLFACFHGCLWLFPASSFWATTCPREWDTKVTTRPHFPFCDLPRFLGLRWGTMSLGLLWCTSGEELAVTCHLMPAFGGLDCTPPHPFFCILH